MAGYDEDRRNIVPMYPDRVPGFPWEPGFPRTPRKRCPDAEKEPWTLPLPPRPTPMPKIVPMPSRDDDEDFAVTKAEVIEQQNKRDDMVLKPVRKAINKALRTGSRAVSIKSYNLLVRQVDILIAEYQAAGWKVKRNTDTDRDGSTWDNLEFS